MPIEFLLTSLIVVLLPGTGVLYTVSIGLTRGAKASLYAALGCTAGIIPHLVASVFGLAAILHASAVLFQILKYVGVLYLAYLAWGMWKDSGALTLTDEESHQTGYLTIASKAVLINLLNPKLSIFFLAFLPQFVPAGQTSPVPYMLILSLVFMLMTFIVFVIYGLLANKIRHAIIQSPKVVRRIQKSFAGLFILMGVKLAAMER
ncbi:LysE family translocator [Vibrio mangrovi]|uniref:Homoserine/homoserine lactone efflux protein n=1 Tax=Vibrio mangrovi TaxID=474394 RepID=A0A1Y6IP08_9VIBR|nr:LysE family translocator [Vibrio mangrovi]MDW6004399.1 LysE family translocator [Vibrio mangrovi]SMR98801.1 Homoserine/homoserine lactone efflux protein [Vibrio mangrovi]